MTDETPAEEADTLSQLLPAPVVAALEKRGFSQLTPVQQAVAEADTALRDLRITSQTGSGKTVAVGFAIARGIVDAGPREGELRRGPTCLVLAPTRELAGQVERELQWLLEGIPDSATEVVTGGTSVGLDRKNLSRGPRVLVGTPGRVLDHLKSGALTAEGIGQVVLDEADQMLDMGFRDELEEILSLLPTERSTHLVSATFAGDVLRIADGYQRHPLAVEGSPLGAANADIMHVAHVVPMRQRYDALINVVLAHLASRADDEPARVLVFARTRIDTAEVADRLQRDGLRAEALSGDMAQNARTRTLEAFRRGSVPILVATDVAARGLDVDGISLVVHGDPPGDAEALTHRSGRTGRAGQKGTSVLFLPPQARRRVERLLHQAGIEPNWLPVPTAAKIEKLYSKRVKRRLFNVLEAGSFEEHLEYARKLLEEGAAEQVVAALLGMVEEKPPITPRDTVVSHLGERHPNKHFPEPYHSGPRHSGPRPGGPGGHRPGGGSGGHRPGPRPGGGSGGHRSGPYPGGSDGHHGGGDQGGGHYGGGRPGGHYGGGHYGGPRQGGAHQGGGHHGGAHHGGGHHAGPKRPGMYTPKRPGHPAHSGGSGEGRPGASGKRFGKKPSRGH